MADITPHTTVQSVSRAVAILRCVGEAGALGLTDISRRLGLHKSTTAGLVSTLRDEKLLVQDENGHYRLGLELFCLAQGARPELTDIGEPHLNRLLEATGETVNLAMRDGDHIVYMMKKESPHSMRISTSVGKRLPLYCTAIGKVMLAFAPDEISESLVHSIELRPFTEHTVASKQALLDELDAIRRDGIACDDEEYEYGLVCVAAPILDRRGFAAAGVSVSGPSMRMGDDARCGIAQTVRRIARDISAELARIM